MGSLRFGSLAWAAVAITLFVLLPACGGHKPAGSSPFPVKVNLNPATSYSVQAGTTFQFVATAQNSSNTNIAPTFTYTSSNPNVVDVAPNGFACAGTFNAPLYTICTAAGTAASTGVVQVTASALGATSAPTLVFVHPPIVNIQISVVTPINAPPPACPNQQALPAACNIPFNTSVCQPNQPCACMSQNQIQTLQATAYDNQGNDITAQVGPFSWSESNGGVVTVAPIVTNNSYNVATNQATASPATPGQTQVIASASGAFSQPYAIETCPVQCIALQVGTLPTGPTSFVSNKGTSETIMATAVDVQGCIVPKPALTWISSAQAALSAGPSQVGCAPGNTCTVTTPQPGAAAITASCTPPTCNVGFPLNLSSFPAGSIYVPQPVYPVTSISGLVTGATSATSVLATSQDCSSDILCAVGIYSVSSTTNLEGEATQLPAAPNSLLFDAAGDKAYAGSAFGAVSVNPANLGTSNNSFTGLRASSNPLGVVTGKVLAVSRNGNVAVFSDTVSTPNQVYLVGATSATSATQLNINSATAAAFSPDGLKIFILGDGGNTLYIYSPLQSLLPPISLPSPATSIVFNSTGSFALLAGGNSASKLAAYNTCDNSPVSSSFSSGLSSGAIPNPPLFLQMVPAGNVPLNSLFGTIVIPNLEPAGLDFFFGLDNAGIDIIATNSAAPLSGLCPQQVSLAEILPLPTPPNPPTLFPPVYINLERGTFHPINFFLSPDATRAYIVTTDFGVLVYNFNTNTVTGIPLINNPVPIAADMSVDGTLIYVAGSDGLLHELDTVLGIDQNQTSFTPLPNSANPFCYTGTNCNLNIVAVKP